MYVPGEVFEPVCTDRVEVPGVDGVTETDVGFNVQVLLFGHPVTLSPTDPLKLFNDVRVAVYVVPDPRRILRLDGDAEMLKSGCAAPFTVSDTVVEWMRVPLVPVIVRV